MPDDEQPEDEDADHDRRNAVQDVQHEPDELAHAGTRKLACEHRYEHPDRHCDQRCERNDDQRADDRVRDTRALALSDAELRRRLREEVEAERLEAVDDDREDDERENENGEQSGETAQPDHHDVDEAPAARSAVVSFEASRQVDGSGADAHRRFRSTWRMITRAIRLKMSERTRRISAR